MGIQVAQLACPVRAVLRGPRCSHCFPALPSLLVRVCQHAQTQWVLCFLRVFVLFSIMAEPSLASPIVSLHFSTFMSEFCVLSFLIMFNNWSERYFIVFFFFLICISLMAGHVERSYISWPVVFLLLRSVCSDSLLLSELDSVFCFHVYVYSGK